MRDFFVSNSYKPFHFLPLVFLFITFLNSCAPVRISQRTFKETPIKDGVQVGLASWYGDDFHGRLTASGVVYDMYGVSAAHKALPFGTIVKAVNLKNNNELEVVINDRGPFVDGRIIDMSYGAAKMLDMVEDGVVPIRIEVIGRDDSYRRTVKGEISGEGVYVVQIGAFLDASIAERLTSALSWNYDGVYIEKAEIGEKVFHRVRIGGFEGPAQAYEQAEKLAEEGYPVWITRSR